MGLFRKAAPKPEPAPELKIAPGELAELKRYARRNLVSVNVTILPNGQVCILANPLNPDAGQLIRRTSSWVRDSAPITPFRSPH
jgi:hypothetical protein